MILLKPYFYFPLLVLAILYVSLNRASPSMVYNCDGQEVIPTVLQAEKINEALHLFKRTPRIKIRPILSFYIKTTQCYNAWANMGKNSIIISQPVIENFTVEELAGILGHEFGHLESPYEVEHWRIDAIGIDLTSKKILIKELGRMKLEIDNSFWNNRLIYIFPLAHENRYELYHDFESRIEKIKSLPD